MRDTSFLSQCAGTRWEWKKAVVPEILGVYTDSTTRMTRDILTGQSDTTQQFPRPPSRLNNQLKSPFTLTVGEVHLGYSSSCAKLTECLKRRGGAGVMILSAICQ